MPSAIVIASDSGIGKASAIRLARDGFDVGRLRLRPSPDAR